MSRWQPEILARIRWLASRHRVALTRKALREMAAIDPEMNAEDVCDVLVSLTRKDVIGRRTSEHTGEWLYIFKPIYGELRLYVKVILRAECVLISFHEDNA